MRILVTGATSGIGKETARALAAMGHDVLVHGRDRDRCRQAVDDIEQGVPGAACSVEVCDLASLGAVRRWAKALQGSGDPLDVVIHNAGVWMNEPTRTPDGWETTWAVNHLAPFLLTSLLLDHLLARPASRVINVSSVGHGSGEIRFEDPNLTEGFSGIRAYCQSKLANVLFAQELARRTRRTSLTTHALHPGTIQTRLLQRTGFGNQPTRSPARGARTSVFLATDPSVAHTSGRYFVDCVERQPATRDPELGRRLWELSTVQCGLA